MISELFILTSRGDAIVSKNYRPDVVRGTAEIFFRKVKSYENGKAPPVFAVEDLHFLHIKRNKLYFVCTTKFNVSPAMVLELLHRVSSLIKDYCGVLSEESIRVNFVLVYELLDEVIDFGYGQNTATESLRQCIYKDPISITPPEQTSIRGIQQQKKKPSSAPNRPILLKRKIRGSKDSKNEVYLDLLERLTVLFDNKGNAIRSEIDGAIQMKCFLHGHPTISIGLNDDLMIGKERGLYGLVLDDCNFHENVNLDKFEDKKQLQFQPPDGEFTVMNYRITGESGGFAHPLPFRVSSVVEEGSSTERRDVLLKLDSELTRKGYGTNIVIKATLPKTTIGCGHEFGTSGHKFSFNKEDKVVTWTIPRLTGSASVYLRLKLSFESQSQISKELSSISMEFEVPMYVCSGMNIKFLHVTERGHNLSPFRWVRYITYTDSYVFRQ
eukprot:m.34145 g.34145  ORF g.34145 m.34145 type:complete len:440 (-) comp9907_c0_seq1:104-1423(-)